MDLLTFEKDRGVMIVDTLSEEFELYKREDFKLRFHNTEFEIALGTKKILGLIPNHCLPEIFYNQVDFGGANGLLGAVIEKEYPEYIFIQSLNLTDDCYFSLRDVEYSTGDRNFKLDYPDFFITIRDIEYLVTQTLIKDYYYLTLEIL